MLRMWKKCRVTLFVLLKTRVSNNDISALFHKLIFTVLLSHALIKITHNWKNCFHLRLVPPLEITQAPIGGCAPRLRTTGTERKRPQHEK